MVRRGKGGVTFRGVIIVRKDSGIEGVRDLIGKKVSIVSVHSAGGFMAQRALLKEKGIDVYSDLFLTEARDNKEENVILEVVKRRADAGFVGEEALGRTSKEDRDVLKVIAYTEEIPNWVFGAHKSVPMGVRKKVKEALLGIPMGDPTLQAAEVEAFVEIPQGLLERYWREVEGRR